MLKEVLRASNIKNKAENLKKGVLLSLFIQKEVFRNNYTIICSTGLLNIFSESSTKLRLIQFNKKLFKVFKIGITKFSNNDIQYLPNQFYILQPSIVQIINTMFIFIAYSVSYGWLANYSVVGYNFSFRTTFRRRLLRLNIGYSRHKLVINIPSSVSVFCKQKRKFSLFSFSFPYMQLIVHYLFYLRNVYPYKVRGIVMESTRMSLLKQGKKVKFK